MTVLDGYLIQVSRAFSSWIGQRSGEPFSSLELIT
jgi:hypothetical protein